MSALVRWLTGKLEEAYAKADLPEIVGHEAGLMAGEQLNDYLYASYDLAGLLGLPAIASFSSRSSDVQCSTEFEVHTHESHQRSDEIDAGIEGWFEVAGGRTPDLPGPAQG